MKPLQIGDLTAKYPLIQGGMGVGVSLGGLAGAVAKEGGIGIISSAQIGFREPDFKTNTVEANLRALGKEIRKAKEVAPGGIVGVNIMVALAHYDKQVKAACEAGADVIISGAGLPSKLPEYVKGFQTKIAPIVSSSKAARVILKLWEKHYDRTADFIVVEGPKAGGHLGFHKEKLPELIGNCAMYDEEIKEIIKVVKEFAQKFSCKIPVVVAGGIGTKEQVEHVLELGANGVQVATRFVTTKECDAALAYKESYINCKKEDIQIVTSPVGMPGRAIANSLIKKLEAGEVFAPKKCFGCLAHCNPKQIPYCITEKLIAAAKGDVENGLLFCGADAWKEEKITSVHEVFASLFD